MALNPDGGFLLFTDGSSWTGDRSGGWAWIAVDLLGHEEAGSGGASDTTNNRMEMQAWIEGLTYLFRVYGPTIVLVQSDSEYVGLGAMDRQRGRSANLDLWQSLDAIIDLHEHVEFAHVYGHQGHAYNERVDKLAGKARKRDH